LTSACVSAPAPRGRSALCSNSAEPPPQRRDGAFTPTEYGMMWEDPLYGKYDKEKAEQFWTRRASEVNGLRAVLSYRVPDYTNSAYSQWELGLLVRDLGDIQGKTVLDVACGVGRVTMELLKGGARVTALDNSAKMLSITEEKVKAASFSAFFDAVKSNAAENPLPDSSYDIVVCVGLLEHLPSTVRIDTLNHLYRVLKSGGRLYLVVNNEHSIFLKADDLYKMKVQKDDGYFVDIIGLDFIKGFYTAQGGQISVLGSNCLHSYIRHTLSMLDVRDRMEHIAEELIRLATLTDLNSACNGETGKYVADQFMVRIVKPSDVTR
jgi:2-polyprenyl-3-methyl-5-hydroxy-6-metoxy-1,4-benzoquinol methylase